MGQSSIVAMSHASLLTSKLFSSNCSLSESIDQVNVLCRGWMMPVLFMPTEDIFHAAGFDAVVMLKTIEFGVQLFTPMALIALAVCAACCPFSLWRG
jgi:Late exocytosis, associated with Golgi transport